MMLQVAKLPKVGVYLYVMCFMGRPHEPLGPVKVGITGNVQSRLSAVQTGSHRRLEVLAAFHTPDRDIARQFELGMHDRLSARRLQGEWFDVDPIAALESACDTFTGILDGLRDVFPGDFNDDGPYTLGRVAIIHFSSQAEELRRWRDHYAETSNVRAIA